MSNSSIEQDRKNPLRRVVPVFLVIIIAFSSSAGCIDKGIADSLVDIVDGDDGGGYVWGYALEPQDRTFVIEPEGNSEIDFQSITGKLIDNVSTLNPQQAIENFKAILNEENLSMVTFPFEFLVFEDTQILNIELTGRFKTTAGDNAWTAGWMELTIMKPGEPSETIQISQLQEKQTHTYSMTPIPGIWKLEVQGTGLQAPGNLLYSGEFTISARANYPKDAL